MRTVNAVKIKDNLVEVLDSLEKDGEPIFLSKGRKIKGVLITPEDFEEKFLERKSRVKKKLVQKIKAFRANSVIKEDSIHVLRVLRGYEG